MAVRPALSSAMVTAISAKTGYSDIWLIEISSNTKLDICAVTTGVHGSTINVPMQYATGC